jgi:hypothetical protein
VYRPRGISELYDYASDPREEANLYGTAPWAALQAELMAGLSEWLVMTADATPLHTDHRGPPSMPYPASACAVSHADGPTGAAAPASVVASSDLLEANGIVGFYD